MPLGCVNRGACVVESLANCYSSRVRDSWILSLAIELPVSSFRDVGDLLSSSIKVA